MRRKAAVDEHGLGGVDYNVEGGFLFSGIQDVILAAGLSDWEMMGGGGGITFCPLLVA